MSGGASAGAGSAKILTTGDIRSLTIGHGITGGAGAGSGAIDVGTAGTGFTAKLGSLSISSGGITGGAGAQSGQVNVGGPVGAVKLDGAAITAGAGAGSGALLATDSIRSISLGSLVIGNSAGAGSGEISIGGDLGSLTFTGASSSAPADSGLVSITGSVGTITVHGNVIGTGDSTGLFLIGSGVKRFSISGSLGSSLSTSDTGTDSGSIFAGLDDTGVIGSLTVSGGIFGGTGDGSGEVFSGGGITKATVGDIIGGAGQSSGSIVSDYALGAIKVTAAGKGVPTHGIIGGTGDDSGQISAGTTMASVSVKGSLLGNAGTGSGSIVSNSVFSDSGDIQGNIGRISITGSITGGTAANSGQISAAGNLRSVTVGGNVTGALASGTGSILAGVDLAASTGGDITTLKIGGTLQGANVPAGQSGAINGSGYIEAGHIGSATIHAIQAGTIGSGSTVSDDGAILAANDIASLRITGSITGTASNPVVISAVGQLTPGKTDLAFGKISVAGNVAYTNFLAGYDQTGPTNGAASIGSVIVAGNWSGSNLVAGVIAGVSGNYGDPTDVLITSSASVIPTIASIIIKGNVTNPPGVTESPETYGFVAGKIEAFTLHGVAQSAAIGVINPVGQSTDTDLRDITTLSP
jgi:hypothetical protein